MQTSTKTIGIAKQEVQNILKRYRLGWKDVAPDQDALIWQKVKPLAKKVRRGLFRKIYSSLKKSV
ncbi:MAG: hypothetical protein AAB911_00800 [Patescibacteria group bacterium]